MEPTLISRWKEGKREKKAIIFSRYPQNEDNDRLVCRWQPIILREKQTRGAGVVATGLRNRLGDNGTNNEGEAIMQKEIELIRVIDFSRLSLCVTKNKKSALILWYYVSYEKLIAKVGVIMQKINYQCKETSIVL